MKFLYDLTAVQPSPESKFHGGGVYGEVVFFKLLEFTDKIDLAAYYDAARYINPAIPEACRAHGIPLIGLGAHTVADIAKELGTERAYSAMLNLNQGWPLGAIDVLTTVHGLRTLEMPADPIMLRYARTPREWLKDALFLTVLRGFFQKKMRAINGRLVADERIRVITISRHSLASIRAFYPETRAREIPVFASPNFAALDGYEPPRPAAGDAELFARLGIEQKKFFLVTSAARWAKNALRAVEAFDALLSDGGAAGFKMVVTGVTDARIFTRRLKNPAQFVFLDYVDRGDLASLTAHEYAFVYPTLNEGFGYPPIEAMQHGVPVAASGTSSVPEVCADAALYFDPYSVSEIKNRLVQLLDGGIYAEYAAKSRARYAAVSALQRADLQRLVEFLVKE